MEQIQLPDGKKVWLVSDYAGTRSVLTDPRLTNDPLRMGDKAPFSAFPESIASVMAHDMLNNDPPHHTRLRRLVTPTFTVRRIGDHRPYVERVAAELIDNFGETPDLVGDFAGPLATTVLGVLLGIAPEDAADVRYWSEMFVLDLLTRNEEAIEATHRLIDYTKALVVARRENPGDDLVSRLVSMHDDEDRLNDEELASMIFTLVIGGQTATTQLLAKALYLLLTHPDQLELLLNDWSLLPSAVHEVLRIDPPLQMTSFRMATEPIELDGKTVPPGDIVVCALKDANRDPARFTDPERFEIRKGDSQHLGFGHGLHRCIGANLAELQCQVGITAFFTRFPHAKPVGEVTWRQTPLITALTSLTVERN
ncbi:cytochrome P450 [Lentzea alba]|uniref:cytochrome P450 n=1 Tax=Lentzea alba TaxID=2714351 RepID=UPI0039BF18D2